MEFTATTIAEYLKGTIEGNPEAKVSEVAPIEKAQEGCLAFLSNPKYASHLYETQATIVLINKDFILEKEVSPTLIRVDDAYKAFASLLDLYMSAMPQKMGIGEKACISKSAVVGKECYIGDLAFVGDNVTIGKNVKLYPHVYLGDNVQVSDNTTLYSGVKVYENCVIGANCIIHSGTVIGSDGFGFAPTDGKYKKIPQIGNVVIEDDVEIGSNVSIDRATMGSTIIRQGVKLDNLIQVAHNVEIGDHTAMAAQVGVSGSTKIGKQCLFGGQVGIAGHIQIANRTQVGAQSGIPKTIKKEGTALFGSPAFDYKLATRSMAAVKNLPELVNRVNQLEKELSILKGERPSK